MADVTCYIYRCSAKADLYIYLAEKDDFNCLPQELIKNLGTLTFSMELTLHENRKLAKEDVKQVINNLQEKGFHLQLPSDTPISEILEKIALKQQSKTD